MNKKSIIWTSLFVIALAIANGILYLTEVGAIRDFILGMVDFDSTAENSYVQNILTDSIIMKAKYAFLVLSILLLASHRLIYKYTKRFLDEVKSTRIFDVKTYRESDSHWVLGLMGALFIAGLILIPFVQINSDEAYCYSYFTSQNPLIALTTYPAPNNHILHSFISSVVDKILPWKLYALRLPSLIAGIASIWVLIMYMRRKYDRQSIFLGALGVMVSFYPLFYLLQGRGYAILLFWSTILAIITIESCNSSKWKYPITSIIVSVLGFYTIPTFLYPFTISLLIMLLFIDWKSVIILGGSTLILTVVLYSPIFLFFGIDALVGNEFVIPMSFDEVAKAYPNYLWAMSIHIIPVLAAMILLAVSTKRSDRDPRYFYLICMVSFSMLIPFFQRIFPPFRTFIYLFPLAFIVLSEIFYEKKNWWPIVPLLLVYNLYFAYNNYFQFNTYSIEAKQILAKAILEKEPTIYLLDGPRSVFQWYLEDFEDPFVNFEYTLNRHSLNKELLQRGDAVFISEYRFEEIFNSSYEKIDSTSYFMLFRKK